MTRRGPSPAWAHRTGGPPACGKRAFSPSGWRSGWTRTSPTSSSTACMACTWRSSRPEWRPARGISRATATPSSRSSRVRGPATPTPGMPSLAPYRGPPSATSRGCSRGCRRTRGGPRTSSTTWSGGPGRWPGLRGWRRSPGLSWPWTMKPSWGGRSRPLRTTGCGARACRWGNEPKSCARRWGWRSATWRREHCWAGPHWGAVACSSPSGGACARGSRHGRTSRRATRSCCSRCAWRRTAATRGPGACGRRRACGHSTVTAFSWIISPAPSRPPPPATICPAAPAGSGPQRPSRGAAAQPPPKCGQRHAGRALLGAWGAVVCPVQEPGLGHQPLLPGWPRGPCGLLGELRLPHGPAPGRAGPPGACPRGPTRGGGGVVLLARAGPPSVPAPPRLGPPGGTPVRGPAQGAGHAPFPGPGAGRLQARKASDA